MNNSLLLSLAYYSDGLKGIVVDVSHEQHFPALGLAAAAVGTAIGLALVYVGQASRLPRSPLPLGEG